VAWGERLNRWRVPALAVLSGLFLAGSMPGSAVPLAWVPILVPLWLAADELLARPGLSRGQRLWRLLGACWAMGAVWAAVTGGWLINTAHVYGGLSLPVAHAVNLVGHALLVGSEFFAVAVIPFVVTRERPRWALAWVPVWGAAVQAYWPHLFMWSFGQFLWPVPALVQAADILGSAGLNLIYLPLQLILFGWVKEALGRPIASRRELAAGTAIVMALLACAAGYGAWRMEWLVAAEARPAVRVVAVQPNFSLKRLASNPALSPSDREQSLGALLSDSERALAEAGPTALPTVVVWPESVYPAAYFRNVPARERVEGWVRARGIHLVLASADAEPAPPGEEGEDGQRIYGIAVHVPPAGSPPEVYRKIFLMPWGEWIPFGRWFPWYRRLLKAWIPQIAEFEAGTEHTVFPVAPGVRVAPLICYDATQVPIAQGMAANGANLALVLANLAWFGPTSASLQFEQVIRFRAIENRLPLFFISQNGRTLLFNARGEPATPALPLFEARSLAADIPLPDVASIFSAHGAWIDRSYAVLALALLGGLARKRGRSP
jgi:apolipoprotein N-acyltransferase